jgi:small nuclear ribonucleoprotein (snRNP)-like protein
MLVELKNGETLNGHLVTCDTWMNLTLKEVVQTSPVSALLLSHLGEELCLHYECERSGDVWCKRVANVQLF